MIQFDKQKILLVDDDTSLLELLSLRLSAVGLTIKSVTNAAEALRSIPLFQPQLVIFGWMILVEWNFFN